MKIYKYRLDITDLQTVWMPIGAKILTVQVQACEPRLWALFDEKVNGTEARRIAIYGTGNPMPDDPGRYIATFQAMGGDLVFHAFELL